MKKMILALVFLLNCFYGSYSIVFVHIGSAVPDYAHVALHQARLFNPNGSIILLTSAKAIKKMSPAKQILGISYISYESLQKTAEHLRFDRDNASKDGFWKYTRERFLYLNDLIQQYALTNVFHLENDNMLYVNLDELLPCFCAYYPGIGATFDNDQRCIPGFLFIANPQAMSALAGCFADFSKTKLNDMAIIAKFRDSRQGAWINQLPILPKEYADVYPLVAANGLTAQNKENYYQHMEQFQSLFDAAAVGQYLGGIDPFHKTSAPGFINESCVFNPSRFQFAWHKDDQGREIPYAVFNGRAYRMNNLHVHSKNLAQFRSVK